MNNKAKDKIIEVLTEKITLLEIITSKIVIENIALKKMLSIKDEQLEKSNKHFEEMNIMIGDLTRQINLINK